MWGDAVRTVYEYPVNVECCGEECACVSGGLVWDIIGHSVRSLQELGAEVAPRAAVRRCSPGIDRPYFMCERFRMRAGVHTFAAEKCSGAIRESVWVWCTRARTGNHPRRCRESA